MSRPFNFTTFDQRLSLQNMLENGMTIRSIAKDLRVDYSGLLKEIRRGKAGKTAYYSAKISQARYEAIIEGSKNPLVFDTLEKRQELKDLFEKLQSCNKTAELLGCSPSSVRRELRRGMVVDENTKCKYDPFAAHNRRRRK